MHKSYLILIYGLVSLLLACRPSSSVPDSISIKGDEHPEQTSIIVNPDGGFRAVDARLNNIDTGSVIYKTRASGDFTYKVAFSINNRDTIKSLQIVKNDGNPDLIFYDTAETHSPPQSSIEDRRKAWVKLCNQHNAGQLVRNLYTAQALYYNHKPMIVGTDSITKEYAYMNNPEYSLSLEPLHVEPVNDSILYEIGQCSGSYGGKYMLVWKLVGDTWQILLDSNI